jgi:hypothetical protein
MSYLLAPIIPTKIVPESQVDGDPYWNNVSVLFQSKNTNNKYSVNDKNWQPIVLNFNSDNGNTIISDNSGFFRDITNTGVTCSTTQVKNGISSGYFNGSSYLSLADDTALEFGTGDFTISTWIYPTSVTGYQAIFGGTNGEFILNLSGSALECGIWYVGGIAGTGSGSIVINTWQHIVVSRRSGILRLYIDGVKKAQVSSADNITYSSSGTRIGASRYATDYAYFNGYMDTFFIDTFQGRYTKDVEEIQPPFPGGPTMETPANFHMGPAGFSETGLVVDEVGYEWTKVGSPYKTRNQIKFGDPAESSLYVSPGNYVKTSYNYWPKLNTIGQKDFTIQAWVHPTAAGYYQGGSYCSGIFSDDAGQFAFYLCGNSTQLQAIYMTFNDVSTGMHWIGWSVPGGIIPHNQWSHVSVSRRGPNVYAHFNGTYCSTQNFSTWSKNVKTAGEWHIGAYSSGYYFTGYLEDVMVYVGQGLYGTSNYTPPTKYSDMQSNYYGGRSLRRHEYDEKNYIYRYRYGAGYGNSQYKSWNPTYADGAYGYWKTETNTIHQLGTADFTIEMWALAESGIDNWARLIENQLYNSATRGYLISKAGAGDDRMIFQISNNGGGGPTLYSNAPIQLGRWFHIAIERYNDKFYMYINGVRQHNVITSANSYDLVSNYFYIGNNISSDGLTHWKGYYGPIRVTKSIARYKKNFVPPTYFPKHGSGTVKNV